ncbi:InlB B-repeat-containing protein [Paramuribaculum intestinale]|uniref:InlB B-repeat-containing protein n=2 Tax=Paramuribaculum intestinale TaxID=2094151 RepID=UPI00338D949F
MKNNLMRSIMAVVTAIVWSVAAVAQTKDSPLSVGFLSEIKDLSSGTVVKIDRLYRVGKFYDNLYVTDGKDGFCAWLSVAASLQNGDDCKSFFDGVTNELVNLVCEVRCQNNVYYLRCTKDCGSTFSGRVLPDAERFHMIPEEVDASKISLEYANRLIRFKGTITSVQSSKPVINESGQITIFGATTCKANKNYLFVGVLGGYSQDISVYVDESIIELQNSSTQLSWSVDGYVNIDGAGSVKVESDEGENLVADGGVVKLTATPAEGYEFVRWTLNGKEVSTEEQYTTDPVLCDIGYVAVFAKENVAVMECDVTVSSSDAEMGEVSVSSGRVVVGTPVTVRAVARQGARFEGWYDGEKKMSGEADYTFLVELSTSLTARFVKIWTVTYEKPSHGEIEVVCDGQTVVSGGTVDDGKYVTVTVRPASNYVVQSIMVDGMAMTADSSASFAVESDISVSADICEAVLPQESLAGLLDGSAAVNSLVSIGMPLTVVAVVGNSRDAVVTDGDRLLLLSNHPAYTGDWKPEEGAVLSDVTGRYEVSSTAVSPKIVLMGAPVTVSGSKREAPVSDVAFADLYADRKSSNNRMLRLRGVNVYLGMVNPVCRNIGQYPDDEQLIRLSQENNSLEITTEMKRDANWTRPMDLTGFVHEVAGELGFHVLTMQPATDMPDDNRVLVNLTASPTSGGKVWIADDETAVQRSCEVGDRMMINAVAADGYVFEGWNAGGISVGAEASMEYQVWGNTTLTAVFSVAGIDPVPPVDPDDPQKERHKLTLRNGGNGSMTVTTADGMEVAGGEMVEEGTRLTVTLTADRMYLPSQLKVNGVPVGQEPDGTYCVTVTGPTELLSVFVSDAAGVYHLRVASRSPEGCSGGKVWIDSDGVTAVEARYGESHAFYADASAGFTFVGWIYEGGTSGPGDGSRFEWPGQGDLSLVAVFDHAIKAERTVSVRSADPTKGRAEIVGESVGVQSVTSRAVVRIRAVAASEYDRFVEWTVNGEVWNEPEIELSGDADMECVAYFASDYPVVFGSIGQGTMTCTMSDISFESGTVVADGAKIGVVLSSADHHHIESLTVNGQEMLSRYLDDPSGFVLSVRSPTDIAAVFAIDRHRLLIGRHLHGNLTVYRSVGADGLGTGDPVASEIYHDFGSTLYVFASAAEGYRLKEITVDGRTLDMSAGYGTIVVTGDMALGCEFEQIPTSLTVVAGDETGGGDGEWFDLNGRRVGRSALRPGSVYIYRSRDGAVSKIVAR